MAGVLRSARFVCVEGFIRGANVIVLYYYIWRSPLRLSIRLLLPL